MKNNFKNLYIVESPFQLISAIEANEYFKKESLLLIKYNGNKVNEKQFELLIKNTNFSEIIKIKSNLYNFGANLKLFYYLKRLFLDNIKFEKIFIGEYRSFHMRKFFDILKPKGCYVLDDGNVSIEIGINIDKMQDLYYFNGVKGYIKKTIYNLELLFFGLNSFSINRNINIYTCFSMELTNIKPIKHSFEYIKSINKSKQSSNLVYFYGANLEEIGLSILKEINYLKQVIDYYITINPAYKIIYIPHRKEKTKKLSRINNELKLEIKYNDYPAEVQSVYDNNIPAHIASFYSTVLITLPLINKYDSCTSFSFSTTEVFAKYKQEIQTTINEYENKMKVVHL